MEQLIEGQVWCDYGPSSACIPPFVLTVLRIKAKSSWVIKNKMDFICTKVQVWNSILPKQKVIVLL